MKMMNPGTDTLEEILSLGQPISSHIGLSYKTGGITTAFNAEKATQGKIDGRVLELMNPAVRTQRRTLNRRRELKRWIPVCHYCGSSGHIRPRCYRRMTN